MAVAMITHVIVVIEVVVGFEVFRAIGEEAV